jgi:hypothetical protein
LQLGGCGARITFKVADTFNDRKIGLFGVNYRKKFHTKIDSNVFVGIDFFLGSITSLI